MQCYHKASKYILIGIQWFYVLHGLIVVCFTGLGPVQPLKCAIFKLCTKDKQKQTILSKLLDAWQITKKTFIQIYKMTYDQCSRTSEKQQKLESGDGLQGNKCKTVIKWHQIVSKATVAPGGIWSRDTPRHIRFCIGKKEKSTTIYSKGKFWEYLPSDMPAT